MKLKQKFLIAGIFLGLFSLSSLATVPFEAYGTDTVAGYPTVLRTSKVEAGKDLIFELTKPNGEVLNFPVVSNLNGVALYQLSDYYTKLAGKYAISFHLKDEDSSFRKNYFNVYPGEISSLKSKVLPEQQVVKTSNGKADITVQLLDDYGNPIADHLVKLISSSIHDEILAVSDKGLTNENGVVSFKIASSESGVVTYSIYDSTADVVLDLKAKVIYMESASSLFSKSSYLISDNVFNSNIENAGGPVSSLKFEDVPSSVKPGQTFSLTIGAYDSTDNLDKNYTGKIRFSVEDGDANAVDLPEDYTFTSSDQGQHTFSLAFTFSETGQYELKVTDLENLNIFGTQEFLVSNTVGNATTSTGIVITNPAEGTYSSNAQVISGTAPAGANLKIFDNDKMIGSVVADISGNFSFTTSALESGEHKIYVASVNEVGTIIESSKVINFTIDSQAPEVSQVVLEPAGNVDASSPVNIKVYISENLLQAAIAVNNNVYDLEDSGKGYYQGTFVAPVEFGEYDVDVILVDELGNESRLEKQATLKVGMIFGAKSTNPGNVANLNVKAGEGKITLNWNAVEGDIDHYRVFYGLSPNQLTEAVDTFTNATTWYVPGLENDKEYYFAVVAVDERGNYSEQFSEIVSATPNPVIINTTVETGTTQEAMDALDQLEDDVSDSGPGVSWLIIISALGGIFYSETRKRQLRK